MIKRIFDIISSSAALIFVSPVFLVVPILIKIDSRGPVFYKQWRMGKDGKNFQIHKFRTMVENADKNGNQITKSEDQRITRIGKILRRYEIDELPTLMNVLKGDMSIVGPRPEIPKFMRYYSNLKYREILSLKPGITDLGTLAFRDETKYLVDENYEEIYEKEILPLKLDMYLKYVHGKSLIIDLKIILETIALIFRQKKI